MPTPTVPTSPVSTKQNASGRVAVSVLDDPNDTQEGTHYYAMAWMANGDGYPLMFGAAKAGDYTPVTTTSSANGAKGCGPTMVVLPNGRTAVLAWVNAKQLVTIGIAKASASNPPRWSLDSTFTIPGSKAAGSPTGCLTQQNGFPVVTLVWQDAGPGCMVYAQINPANVKNSLGFAPLGESCLDTPCLDRDGPCTILTYTRTNGQIALVCDVRGGVDFDFANAFLPAGMTSTYGPCLVPLNPTTAYLIWAAGTQVNYQQLGIGSDGNWQVNSDPATSGNLAIAAMAAPTGQLLPDTVEGTGPIVLVAVPGKDNVIQLAGFVPDFSPITIVQA